MLYRVGLELRKQFFGGIGRDGGHAVHCIFLEIVAGQLLGVGLGARDKGVLARGTGEGRNLPVLDLHRDLGCRCGSRHLGRLHVIAHGPVGKLHPRAAWGAVDRRSDVADGSGAAVGQGDLVALGQFSLG